MPCTFSFVQPITVKMNNAILISPEGTLMLNNVLAVIGLTNATASLAGRGTKEFISVNKDGRICRIFADEIVFDYSSDELMFQSLVAALPRLRGLRLQTMVVEEFKDVAQEVEWFPDGRVKVTT